MNKKNSEIKKNYFKVKKKLFILKKTPLKFNFVSSHS